jgi:hypothetical protein
VAEDINSEPRPFNLTKSGPLYRIQKRVGLIRENAPLAKRIALLAAMFTWLPLFILSMMQGLAWGHSVPVSFLEDFSAYTRFLLAIPLLLLAENIIGPRLAETASHFVKARVVLEKDFPKFDEIVERGLLARDSILAEVILVVIAYILSFVAFRSTPAHISTWYRTVSDSGDSLTWAGIWLVVVCVPLFQFLTLRWLWRLFLWFQFLNRVRKLDLQLFPTHPDQAGGLGFVGEGQRFFGILLFAFSIGTSGVLAREIVYGKIPLTYFVPAIGTYVVVALIIIIIPLTVFTGILIKTRRVGLRQYGTLATTYTGLFQKRWIWHENPDNEPLLGTGDIQSLADLGNSYSFVLKMTPLPVDLRTLLQLVVASLLPLAPLLLTVMPLESILKLVFKAMM